MRRYLILGFFPWIAFLPMAFVYGARRLNDPRTDANTARLLRLGLTWSIVPLVFFSFAKTKLPNYIALEFPALALVTALYFDAIVREGASRSALVSAGTVPVFIGSGCVRDRAFTRDNKLSADALSVTPVLSAMGAAIFVGSVSDRLVNGAPRRTSAAAPYALAFATLVAMDVLAVFAIPYAEALKPVPQLARVIQHERRDGDVVAIQSFRGGNA